ncbi:MAG: CRISPR-associated endonuclease Cas9 [Anaerolineales bacterium]|nr:CRISPR-associated endonuclease Cas9 [Anaerolineales bacterium]
MTRYLPARLREQLLAADDQRCAYCHTTEANTGQPMTVDHIVPQAQGGPTTFDNLCYACRRCNEFKGSATAGHDPLTGETIVLFNPRTRAWTDHFSWDASETHIVGLTAVGRATVIALNMNNEVIVDARRRWMGAGWHPPEP